MSSDEDVDYSFDDDHANIDDSEEARRRLDFNESAPDDASLSRPGNDISELDPEKVGGERRYRTDELPILFQKLKVFCDENRNTKIGEEKRKLELEAFLQLRQENTNSSHNADAHIIPKFYDTLPKEEDVLKAKLRDDAGTLLLQKKSGEIVSSEALEALLPILDRHQSPPIVGDEKMMNFNDFIAAGKEADQCCAHYFKARIFAKLLEKDPFGRVSINTFFKYIMRREWLKQAHIGLSLYDTSGQGYLLESDLETYIYELIPTMPQLKHLQDMFLPFYVCTATRKFIFFLDPKRSGKVRISEILISGFLDDLLELREEEVPNEKLQTNWFSAASAFRVYSQFLSMDQDRNGMLSRDELASYGNGTLTNVFLDRLFQECLTFGGEMDYKMYMDFVLAMENKEQPRSLAFFFRIFDIRHKGYLDAFDLNFFFRDIREQLAQRGEELVTFEDVKDEIFDMVKPKRGDKSLIFLDDLIDSGQGKTIVSILTDIHGFCAYENRERIAADQCVDDNE